MHLSEGSDPSSSYDEGSRSTPNNLPKAATRSRKKRTSDSEDEDYVAIEEEVSSKKKALKKEYGTAATTKPGRHKKIPAKRVPTLKARASTADTSKPSEEAAGEGKKRKERVKKTIARVIGRSSMFRDPAEEDEEEEDVAPPTKTQKLMGDAIKSGASTSKPKTAPRLLLKLRSLLSPREAPGTSQLKRRTRPQCLKLKKKMMKPKC